MSETPEAYRGRLAQTLCKEAGLSGEVSRKQVEAASADAGYVDEVVEGLLSVGALHPDPGDPVGAVVHLGRLQSLPQGSELGDALDRKRAEPLSALQQVRLARLYGLCGHEEKAASCFRAVLARDEPLCLALAVDVGEAAAASGSKPLALAAVDWVAECLLTRDDVSEGAPSQDEVRQDPLATASLLQRSCDVALKVGYAPRAVALSKAAANIYERVGRDDELRRCVATLSRAHGAAGQGKEALTAAKRLRELARKAKATRDEATALGLVAARLEEAKPAEARKLHGEAAKLLSGAGKVGRALEHVQHMARLLRQEGKLDQARKTLEQAAGTASKAGLTALHLELTDEALQIDQALGCLDRVLAEGDKLRRGWTELGEPERAARAVIVFAGALVHAGDVDRARKALSRGSLGGDDWLTAGLSLRVRAELEVMEDRLPDARCLLVDAARAADAAQAKPLVAESLLRRAELALDLDEPDQCKQDLQQVRQRAGTLPRDLELRAEIVRARLCDDLDEREILLEEAYGRATTEGLLLDRSLAAAAKGRHHLMAGEPSMAEETLSPVLGELLRVRDTLPEKLRDGFRRSPLIKQILSLANDPAMKG